MQHVTACVCSKTQGVRKHELHGCESDPSKVECTAGTIETGHEKRNGGWLLPSCRQNTESWLLWKTRGP